MSFDWKMLQRKVVNVFIISSSNSTQVIQLSQYLFSVNHCVQTRLSDQAFLIYFCLQDGVAVLKDFGPKQVWVDKDKVSATRISSG